MQPIQLRLFDAHVEEIEVVCPHCGHHFDLRVASLTPATRLVWDAGGPRWQHGQETLGPSELAARRGLTPPAVRRHLQVLVEVGLVDAVPQNKYRRERHVYKGKLGYEHA